MSSEVVFLHTTSVLERLRSPVLVLGPSAITTARHLPFELRDGPHNHKSPERRSHITRGIATPAPNSLPSTQLAHSVSLNMFSHPEKLHARLSAT